MRHHLFLGLADRRIAVLLDRDRVGGAQILLDQAEDFLFKDALVDDLDFTRLFRGFLGEFDDRLDHRLEVPVAEHHGAEHDVFVELLGFRFNHQHGVGGAGDDQIELGLYHLVERGIEHIFVVDEADARGTDRALEGRAGYRQRGGGCHQRQDVGIVLHVVRQHGDDHLGFIAPAIDEQGTDRTIDQAGNQRFLFGRTPFALEIAAGNAARGIGLFDVVDGQRQEVDAFARRLRSDDGGEHDGLAVGGEHGAVGLTGDLAGFQLEGTSTPVDLDGMLIEHIGFFHGFTRERGPKTQRPCARLRDADRNTRSASGDPAMVFIFRMASILSAVTGTLPCPAAGLLLDVVEHDPYRTMLLRMIVSEKFGVRFPEDHAKTRANSARTLSNQRRMLCFSSNAL